MLARLLDDPHGRPRRIVQVLVEARCAARERLDRVVEAVADVAVRTESEIHRPDEDGAMRLLEGRIEVRVMPESGTDPHEPASLFRASRDAVGDAPRDFV